MKLTIKKGAMLGFVIGLVINAVVFAVALSCFSIRLSSQTQPWAWYCSDPAFNIIGYFAFPVNLLTNDLSKAVLLSPVSLLVYTIVGGLIGSFNSAKKSSLNEE
ncbi:MAG: hypothetical protein E4H27_10505 [Anaerolineales bacterium]|nr:MAG: hypothetical protein E4H27_10505 [Anaerolineales bacterium]